MKRKMLLIISGLLAVSLSACQGRKDSLAETCWKEAKEAGHIKQYAAEKGNEIDLEMLKEEADSAENDMRRQFQAVTLLCALEFQNGFSRDALQAADATDADMYRFDYPVSAAYAEKFLAKAAEQADGFWEAIEEAFYPYDCFAPLFAAAEAIDAEALAALRNVPEDSKYRDSFLSAVDKWIEENPEDIVKIGDVLTQDGYFSEWKADEWKQTYFHSYLEDDHIQVDTLEDAASYITYVRSSMLPALKKQFGKKEFQQNGEYSGRPYYTTELTITVKEGLKLGKPGKKNATGNVKTEGKKVAAFYRNTSKDEWEGSPAEWRVLGDFMLGLSKKEYPASIADADYYLVLTPEYERGEFYQDQSGNETKVQEVYSSTSIDLYEAKSGKFLRHIGNVSEQPDTAIFEDLSAEILRYPQIVSADVLSYIYHNINHPDRYVTLLDNTAGAGSQLQSGEPIVLGNWEITYTSSQIVKSFDEGMFRYTANDGYQYVRAEIKVTNRSKQQDTFLPLVYWSGEDPIVQIMDAAGENTYDSVHAINDSRCLNSTTLDAGESKEGELIFEVPDEVLQNEEALYVLVSMGKQQVTYRLK